MKIKNDPRYKGKQVQWENTIDFIPEQDGYLIVQEMGSIRFEGARRTWEVSRIALTQFEMDQLIAAVGKLRRLHDKESSTKESSAKEDEGNGDTKAHASIGEA